MECYFIYLSYKYPLSERESISSEVVPSVTAAAHQAGWEGNFNTPFTDVGPE